MVFYRKYRPQTLDDLIGQQTAKTLLSKALASGKFSHAYLFCGPRGTGKTSTARIIAKAVNCEVEGGALRVGSGNESSTTNEPRATTVPCNQCATCLSITDGSNLDLIEIDAASNRGIDDIRALRETIKLSPTQAKKKVYIIDEVHMLTTEAFNALLKTLEEPPSHVMFILATTDPQKIPQTILSRVQRVDFQLAKEDELVAALKKIVDAEKLEADDDALMLLAKKSEGSFRDGVKLLDQLASRGEKITVQLVEENFKLGSFESLTNILQSIASKDPTKSLEIVSQELEKGTNAKDFILGLLDMSRTILFIKHGAMQKVAGIDQEKSKILQKIAAEFSLTELIRLIDSLHLALERMKTSSIPSLPLEVAVVENCQVREQVVVAVPSVTRSSLSAPSVSQTAPIGEKSKDEPQKRVEEKSEAHSGVDDLAPAANGADLTKIMDKWQFILETVKPYNYSLEAMLKQVKVTSCDDGMVVLEVPYSFHQRIIEAPKSRTLLESVISDVLGKEAKVTCTLGARPLKIEEVANLEVAEDDEVLRIAAEIFNSDSVS